MSFLAFYTHPKLPWASALSVRSSEILFVFCEVRGWRVSQREVLGVKRAGARTPDRLTGMTNPAQPLPRQHFPGPSVVLLWLLMLLRRLSEPCSPSHSACWAWMVSLPSLPPRLETCVCPS